MIAAAVALLTGLLFGVGLIVAGMADPAKVLGFLDLSGRWDPSLAFVMGGAILVGLAGFAAARARSRSILGHPMPPRPANRVDARLLLGATLFGAGWGLSGICPGPALVLMGAGEPKGWVFGLAMLAGMGLFQATTRRS